MFYIPFLYFYKSRLKSIKKLISWFFIYIIPIIISYLFLFQDENIINIIIYLIGIYTIYEIGYIYNDTETIKKEENPTIRLSLEQIKFYENNKLSIYLFRLIFSFCMILLLRNAIDLNLAICSYILLFVLFYIYNNIRSILNLPLHFLLVIIRFSSFILVFGQSFKLFVLSIFIFPVLNLIERAGELRFGLITLQHDFFSNHNRFRIIYYSLLFLASYMMFGFYYWLSVVSFYMLIYRVISPLVFNYLNNFVK